jgi:cytochrome c-type biogenesis protein CcmH/NrfG
MNKNVQADRHLKKAIELDSSIAEAYIYLAGIRMRQQKYKSAAIILDQALVLNPIHKIGNMMKSELNQIK